MHMQGIKTNALLFSQVENYAALSITRHIIGPSLIFKTIIHCPKYHKITLTQARI